MATPKDPNRPLIVAGPFVGVNDAIPLSAQETNRLSALQNGYIRSPELGDDVVSRPGFTRRTVASVSGVPARLGTPTAPLYAITALQGLDGTYYNLGIVSVPYNGAGAVSEAFRNGAATAFSILVRWNPVTDTYIYAMDAGTPNVVHLFDASATRLWFTQFAGYLILNDGINRLLKWDPGFTPGADSVSQLTATSDVVYGPPTVYAGKLFYIDAADRVTIKWSAENDPDTGYTGSNAWTFRQTSSDRLSRLVGTNDSLLVFRENSITNIWGESNADFQSASTLENIDSNIGTKSPGAVCLVNDEVWFLDQFGRPQKIVPGRGIVPLWQRCYETIKDLSKADDMLYQAWATFIPELEVVVFGMRTGTSVNCRLLAFSSRTDEFLGLWSCATLIVNWQYGTLYRDSGNQASLAMMPYTTGLSFVNQKQETDATVASDTGGASVADVNVPFVLRTMKLYGDIEMAKTFTRVVATTRISAVSDVAPTLTAFWRGSRGATDGGAEMLTTAPPLATSPDFPVRAVSAMELQVTRWIIVGVQGPFETSGPQLTTRTVVGQFMVYGTESLMDWQEP